MKKSFILYLLFFSFPAATISQDVESQVKIAKEYFDNEKYDSAAVLFESALPLIGKKYGLTDTVYYARQVKLMARSFLYISQFDQAEKYFIQVKSIYKNLHDSISAGYAEILNNLGSVYFFSGDFKTSLSVAEEVIRIRKALSGINNPEYASALSDKGNIYYEMGNYEAALPLFEEVKRIRLEVLGPEHPDYANSLKDLAILYRVMGNYEAALPLINEASLIIKSVYGEKSFDYSSILNVLGLFYYDMGNFEAAISHYKEANAIDKELSVPHNQEYATVLGNLALAYVGMKNYELAIPLYQEAAEIDKEILGDKHPAYATQLYNLATVYHWKKNLEMAYHLYKEAVIIFTDAFGPKNPNSAICLSSLGLICSAMGKYDTAIILLTEAKSTLREVFGEEHENYYSTLRTFAAIYMETGQIRDGLMMIEEANKRVNQNIMNNFFILSNEERLKYLIKDNNYYDFYFAYLKQAFPGLQEFSRQGYNNELLLKGLVLGSISNMQRGILESGDTTLIRHYEQMRYLNKQIASELQQPISNRQENFSEMETEAKNLERELSQRSKTFSEMQASFRIRWEDVRKMLKAHEAAIEFINFTEPAWGNDTIYYCALVLRSNDTIPRFVPLCDESLLRKAVAPFQVGPNAIDLAYKKEERGITMVRTAINNRLLYDLVWKPVDSLLQGINTVYYAPTGLLNSLAFSAIPCPDDQLLMEKFNLVQLSSTRTLALEREPLKITNAAVYGGIQYDSDTTRMLAQARKYAKKEDVLLAYNRSASTELPKGFSYLPGTEKEAELISTALSRKGISSTLFSGTEASEESFISLSGKNSPSVIHFSTHGFYYPDTTSDGIGKKTSSGTGGAQFRFSDDPLLRSGLLMSGANVAWKGGRLPEGLEDGILTAKEVSNMNLMNTQLVVLSACQTGLGDVKGSEGVEGLQRGFKMAGARYIIMSLWEIPDKETTEFMSSFYDYWLGGQEIREAFRTTQLNMSKKYKGEPSKWAGFVLME